MANPFSLQRIPNSPFLRYIMCYKMRSCFPRRLQWGYESNHSETPECRAQTVSCWAAAAGCWWGSPVGDHEALCLGSEFRASALQTTTGSKDSSENWQWHTKAVVHISVVCHFHGFVSKRCQIKNGCTTDQDHGQLFDHVQSGTRFSSHLHTAGCSEIFAVLCLHAEGSDAEHPCIPRAGTSRQWGFRQQVPIQAGWVSLEGQGLLLHMQALTNEPTA